MTSVAPVSEVFLFRPPTPAEVDQLATISAISFIVGALSYFVVVGAALAVAVKTQLPGRWAILFSTVLLAVWWGVVQYMGGDLEATFGPVALLVTYTVYSAAAVLFSIGYLRMSFAVFRQRAAQATSNVA